MTKPSYSEYKLTLIHSNGYGMRDGICLCFVLSQEVFLEVFELWKCLLDVLGVCSLVLLFLILEGWTL